MEIFIDDRERAVINYVKAVHRDTIKFTIKRMQVGDYAISYNNNLLLIIERKTWPDLAASIRDGRKNNIQKIINIRAQTNCKIAYLIEGDPCPRSTKYFGRMPIKNLRAHLDHLAFRDGVHMIYTISQRGTAERIFELAKNLFTIRNTLTIEHLEQPEQLEQPLEQPEHPTIEKNNNVHLLTLKQQSTISIQEQLLMCLPSIGSTIATVMAENNISLLDLYHGINPVIIARLKYPTGNSIGLIKANKIVNNKKYLIKTNKNDIKFQIRILSSIPLISKKTAAIILNNVLFKDILDNQITIEQLSQIDRSAKSKLGVKASSNILHYLLNK